MSPRTVSLFCGGRGSSTLVRELIRRPHIELNLLVNAYDDGMSTGALRRLIPEMLGPSDFRKNLSYLLVRHSPQQFDLARMLEARLPVGCTDDALRKLAHRLQTGRGAAGDELGALFRDLEPLRRRELGRYLATFLDHARGQGGAFEFADCALGNLIFAGAFLESDRDFNRTVRRLALTMGTEANLVNVSRGEPRTLVAVKADGQLLDCEARVVAPQSAAKIAGMFLLPAPLGAPEVAALDRLDLAGKLAFLAAREAPVDLSDEARDALERSDLVLFGPGTQHSSLLPSYKTRGLCDALARSPARVKALVVNLRADHDIPGATAEDVLELALAYLGDPTNATRAVTHVLHDPSVEDGERPAVRRRAGAGAEGGAAATVTWVAGALEAIHPRGVHNGRAAVDAAVSAYRAAGPASARRIELYADLDERSASAELLVQELAEIAWRDRFDEVRLCLNGVSAPAPELPAPFVVTTSAYEGPFSEVAAFRAWLESGTSEYLVTLTGDGEFRLQDILPAIRLLEDSAFGVVHGSRSQSRMQFRGSLEDAYGESAPVFWLSWLGGYAFSALFALRFRVTLSDPFTGFRVYRRSAMPDRARLARHPLRTASHISRFLLAESVELAEIPVSYRTFRGFTRASTRLSRGLKNALGLLL